jgi:CheY-like chemotaxis protein
MGEQIAGSLALVVDDDPFLLQDFVDQFHAAGCLVVAANSAETALALLQRGYEIDIAVIDVHLSGNMDGLELARVLRAIGCTAPIVYVSGYLVHTDQMVPGSLYRSKPVAPRDMVMISQAVLAGDSLPPDEMP